MFSVKNRRFRMFLFTFFSVNLFRYGILQNRYLNFWRHFENAQSNLEVYNTCRGLHQACTAYAGGDW